MCNLQHSEESWTNWPSSLQYPVTEQTKSAARPFWMDLFCNTKLYCKIMQAIHNTDIFVCLTSIITTLLCIYYVIQDWCLSVSVKFEHYYFFFWFRILIIMSFFFPLYFLCEKNQEVIIHITGLWKRKTSRPTCASETDANDT